LTTTAVGGAVSTTIGGAATVIGSSAIGGAIGTAATSVIGGSGIFGTTIGASGVTGALMSAGVLSSTPVIVPASIGLIITGGGYITYRFLRLKNKIKSAKNGEEVYFSEKEASIIEGIIRKFG